MILPLKHRRTPTQMTPAWIVCAWPPLLWQVECAPELHFVHLGTRVLSTGDAEHPCSGQTVWGNPSRDHAAGVAWDWVEVQEGVVAMADPLALVTNLQFTDARGAVLPTMQAALHLNEIVHTLPWQSEVQRALHRAAA
ncbi:MAG TPA: hypothetical protein VJ743_10705 [Albitalea sp.]|nr:hypothetical protein [Albitalea sp.]